MNTVAWLMFGNMILAGIVLYQIYVSRELAALLDEMYVKNFGRMSELLDKCAKLRDKRNE